MVPNYQGPLPPVLRPARKARRRRGRFILWFALLLVVGLRFLIPSSPVTQILRPQPWRFEPGGGQRSGGVFAGFTPQAEIPKDLWRLEIQVSESDADILRGYHWRWQGRRGTGERPEVLATVREGDQVYTNVALHLKGSAGSFRAFDDRPALTLNFSKQAKGQRFHDFSKISLNNSVQDASYLSEAISRELFLAAGVPTPRATHATVVLNGRDLGLYVLTEGWGKPFLRHHFRQVGGNLYDGGFLQDINNRLDTNSGDHEDDRSDLDRLLAAAQEPNADRRWERLNSTLDMDRFLSFLAMEVMTCHWDGYALNRNNYRVFHDLETDRMVFMPHGMDQMFGTFRSHPGSTIVPQMEAIVARAVFSTRPGRQQYLDRVATLRSNVFLPEKLTARVRELAAHLRPTLAAYSPRMARNHDGQVEFLCQRITQRAESIASQLLQLPAPLEFDASGFARLDHWGPHLTRQSSRPPAFDRFREGGRDILRIRVQDGATTASWRTGVLLEQGRYRVTGLAQTRDIPRGGGVHLRISGGRNDSLLRSEGEWQPIDFALDVDQGVGEAVIVAEVIADRGEAWFDADSLRIERR